MLGADLHARDKKGRTGEQHITPHFSCSSKLVKCWCWECMSQWYPRNNSRRIWLGCNAVFSQLILGGTFWDFYQSSLSISLLVFFFGIILLLLDIRRTPLQIVLFILSICQLFTWRAWGSTQTPPGLFCSWDSRTLRMHRAPWHNSSPRNHTCCECLSVAYQRRHKEPKTSYTDHMHKYLFELCI